MREMSLKYWESHLCCSTRYFSLFLFFGFRDELKYQADPFWTMEKIVFKLNESLKSLKKEPG